MRYLYYLLLAGLMWSCGENYTPKPYGYYRIEFPDKSYKNSEGRLPYRFQLAREAFIENDRSPDAEPYWINIVYPAYNAKINLSYKPITTDSTLQLLQQDCHRMAYAHTIKAESIDERFYQQDDGNFGLLYLIEGNAASPVQFFMTDSTRHFIRGALYIATHPNKDSLAPVIDYLRSDVVHLMETLDFQPLPHQ